MNIATYMKTTFSPSINKNKYNEEIDPSEILIYDFDKITI